MAKLIRNGQVVHDDWQVLIPEKGEAAATIAQPSGRTIVPLAAWVAHREGSVARTDIGVWLDGGDDPEAIATDLGHLPIVAIRFPKFADGRGYSLAYLLRTRYEYQGELRAIGEVLRDQFDSLRRCGFDAFKPREGRYDAAQLETSLASLSNFTHPYQASAHPADPLFRRVRRAA